MSADSRGQVQFWSSDFGTLKYTLKGHDNDVIAVAALSDTAVCSAGIDGRLVFYKRAPGSVSPQVTCVDCSDDILMRTHAHG